MLLDRIVKVRDARATLKLLQHDHSDHECADRTTMAALREAGVSSSMMEAFWKPFLSGIMLDPELKTSSRFLDFVLANFAKGNATVPGDGMRRLPELMLGSLPVGAVRTGIKVKSIEKRKVRMAGGGKLEADAVVVATDGRTAAKLLDGISAPETVAVGQIAYNAGPRPPHDRPILVLDGDNSGPVNNLQVMSNVAPGYAPVGSSLVTCTILEKDLDSDDDRLDHAVRSQLGRWYGPGVAEWDRLKVDRIERALPSQPVGSLDPLERPLRLRSWLWVAGDHRATASIEGALATGRHAGEQVVAALSEEG
jgi:protoporphyrinogen oxidase